MKVDFRKKHNNFIFRLSQLMESHNLNYMYCGNFDQHVIIDILSLTEKNIVNASESSRIKKKVCNLMVESLQNITRHQAANKGPEENGIFFIQNLGSKYFITTGNLIATEEILPLKQKLELINSLSKTELREFYRKQLSLAELSEKGGAGLGFLDMARKSGNKFSFDFQEVSDTCSFFYFRMQIASDSNKAEDAEEVESIKNLEYIKELHDIIQGQNILLIYNDIFDEKSKLNFLSHVKSQIDEATFVKDEVYDVMVEMIENIIKHATCEDDEKRELKPAILFITEKDKEFHLFSGNYIDTKDAESIHEKIARINSMSNKELIELYGIDPKDNNTMRGLGIVNIKIKSLRDVYCEFLSHNQQHAYLTIEATVEKH